MIEPWEDLFKSDEEKIEILIEKAKKRGTDIKIDCLLIVSIRELGGQGETVLFTAGAYNLDNSFKIVGKGGDVDAVVHGRYHSEAAYVGNCRWFILNPDLERRLKEGIPLTKYD